MKGKRERKGERLMIQEEMLILYSTREKGKHNITRVREQQKTGTRDM